MELGGIKGTSNIVPNQDTTLEKRVEKEGTEVSGRSARNEKNSEQTRQEKTRTQIDKRDRLKATESRNEIQREQKQNSDPIQKDSGNAANSIDVVG